MRYARACILASVLATAGCGGAGALPMLELSLSHRLTAARGPDTRRVRSTSWVGAGLRWRQRDATMGGSDAGQDAAASRAQRLDATCSVAAACRWERDERAQALADLPRETTR